MQHVAADRDQQAVEMALVAADGEGVEQRLGAGARELPSPALMTEPSTLRASSSTAPEA